MKPEYDSKSTDDPELAKELTLQVRKVIGPFAAPKKIVSLVSFLDKPMNQSIIFFFIKTPIFPIHPPYSSPNSLIPRLHQTGHS
jgi:hypothetical protein